MSFYPTHWRYAKLPNSPSDLFLTFYRLLNLRHMLIIKYSIFEVLLAILILSDVRKDMIENLEIIQDYKSIGFN
jgi:hypothetical protein